MGFAWAGPPGVGLVHERVVMDIVVWNLTLETSVGEINVTRRLVNHLVSDHNEKILIKSFNSLTLKHALH